MKLDFIMFLFYGLIYIMHTFIQIILYLNGGQSLIELFIITHSFVLFLFVIIIVLECVSPKLNEGEGKGK